MNVVVFNGNLTRDPVATQVSEKANVTKFSVAINEGYVKDGKWVSEPVFVDVEAWGPLGERVANLAAKGSPVTVSGKLRFNKWSDNDGNTRTKLSVVANKVEVKAKLENTVTHEIDDTEEELDIAVDETEEVPF